MRRRKDPSLEKEQENCVRSICQVLTDNEDYETAIPWLLKLQETRRGHRGELPAALRKRTP